MSKKSLPAGVIDLNRTLGQRQIEFAQAWEANTLPEDQILRSDICADLYMSASSCFGAIGEEEEATRLLALSLFHREEHARLAEEARRGREEFLAARERRRRETASRAATDVLRW